MRSALAKFDHIVAAIEEFKDLSQLSLHELKGSIQAHQERMSMFIDQKLFNPKYEIGYIREKVCGG